MRVGEIGHVTCQQLEVTRVSVKSSQESDSNKTFGFLYTSIDVLTYRCLYRHKQTFSYNGAERPRSLIRILERDTTVEVCLLVQSYVSFRNQNPDPVVRCIALKISLRRYKYLNNFFFFFKTGFIPETT